MNDIAEKLFRRTREPLPEFPSVSPGATIETPAKRNRGKACVSLLILKALHSILQGNVESVQVEDHGEHCYTVFLTDIGTGSSGGTRRRSGVRFDAATGEVTHCYYPQGLTYAVTYHLPIAFFAEALVQTTDFEKSRAGDLLDAWEEVLKIRAKLGAEWEKDPAMIDALLTACDELYFYMRYGWVAPDTLAVIEDAREILGILGLPEGYPAPRWLTALVGNDIPDDRSAPPLPMPGRGSGEDEGESGGKDEGSSAGESGGKDEGESGGEDKGSSAGESGGEDQGKSEGEGAESLASLIPEHEEGNDRYKICPAPYLELEEAARPLARAWVEQLRTPTPVQRARPHETRGRYKYRQHCRTPERPFVLREEARPTPDFPAIEVLVDRSSSMYRRMGFVRLALMSLNLACDELGIPLAITVFGGDYSHIDKRNIVTVKEYGERGELPKARIAAITGHTGYEFLYSALTQRGPILARRREKTRLLLVVHDGWPVYAGYPGGKDKTLSRRWLADFQERGGAVVIGILLTEGEGDEEFVEEAKKFFPCHLIISTPAELPRRLGNILRCFAPRR